MSVWRRKALEVLPELRQELQDKEMSIYSFFFELLPAVIEAHEKDDREALKKMYAFASWCFRQHDKDLWNAAGVCFYEHLPDHELTLKGMPVWVDREIYADIRELIRIRVEDDKYAALEAAMKK